MKDRIAYCGIPCHECGAFVATKNNDNEMRSKVARAWSRQNRIEIKPEDINCDGCLSDRGRLFGYCARCEMRKCAKGKGVTNCMRCDDYICDSLEGFFQMVLYAKKRLDEIRTVDL